MWRALFLAIGLYLVILGGELLIVDRVFLRDSYQNDSTLGKMIAGSGSGSVASFKPPDWFPWSLFSAGAVVMIYSFTIPKRVKN